MGILVCFTLITVTLIMIPFTAIWTISTSPQAAPASVEGDPQPVVVEPVSEETPALPLCPYGYSKLRGEMYGRILAERHGFSFIALRYFNTYGANPVCCAAALATLDLLEDGLMRNAQKMGARLLDGAKRLRGQSGGAGPFHQ